MTKYCYDPDHGENGFTDNKYILDPSDDIVRKRLGGNWRMPTKGEIEELISNTTFRQDYQNGVYGAGLWSNNNDTRIFFPNNNDLDRSRGYYWTSSLSMEDPSCALIFDFYATRIF